MTRAAAMPVLRHHRVAALGTLVLMSTLTGCASSTIGAAATLSPTSPSTSPASCAAAVATARPDVGEQTLQRAGEVVASLSTRAWNPEAPARQEQTPGGVFINWRPAWDGSSSSTAATDVATDGLSDGQAGRPARHDPLADLLILRGVTGYLAAGGGDAASRELVCRLRPVVAREFASYGVDRAWVYGVLVDLSVLDSQGSWLAAARRYADLLASTFVDPVTGAAHEPGSSTYRSDYAAETAAALADAGARFGRPDWTELGRRVGVSLVTRAADPTTGLFAGTMTLRAGARDAVADPLVKVGAQAQVLDALLTVYDRTRDPSILASVTRAVATLDDPGVGIRDPRSGGWYFAVDVSGADARTSYKETRQAWMLPLARHLRATTGHDALGVPTLEVLVRDRLYRTSGAGYAYRVAPDFASYSHGAEGGRLVEDWISTEATGIALTALLPVRTGVPVESGAAAASAEAAVCTGSGAVDVTAPLLPSGAAGAQPNDSDADVALDPLSDPSDDPQSSGTADTGTTC